MNRLDPDGYIIPEADLDKVQPEYGGVPEAAAEALVGRLGSRLHSGHVYGSVGIATRLREARAAHVR